MELSQIIFEYTSHYPMFNQLESIVERDLRQFLLNNELLVEKFFSKLKTQSEFQARVLQGSKVYQSSRDIDDTLSFELSLKTRLSVQEISDLLGVAFQIDQEKSILSKVNHLHNLKLLCRYPVPGSEFFDEQPWVWVEFKITLAE